MKPLFRILLFIFIVGFAIFSGCHKPDDSNTCNDPIREYKFPTNASKWLFDPIKPGDTLKFNVYHRTNRASPYVYRRIENFTIKDTMIKKFTVANEHTDLNCNAQMINDYLIADITGPEPITCQLTNDYTTQLLVLFEGKQFEGGADQYSSQQFDWYDSLIIGGQKYINIKTCKGVNPFSNSYADSTYMFYNLQYGMLKFIINDTLIYQRTLH